MEKIMIFLKENLIIKIAIFALSLIFPLMLYIDVFLMKSTLPISSFDITWLGFYSCIVLCYVLKNKVLKAALGLLNMGGIFFLCFASLAGGAKGPLWVIAKTLIPFLSLS